MDHSYSKDGDRRSAGKEIPRILWNRRVHYHVHKSTYVSGSSHHEPNEPSPYDPVLFLYNTVMLIHMPMSSKWLLPFSFPDQSFVYVSHISLCPVHLTPLDFSILKIQQLLNGRNLEVPHWTYATFSSHLLLPRLKYSPKLSVLKHH
jgi:hypothetical protein